MNIRVSIQNKKLGFTLTEVIVVTAVSTLLMLAITGSIVSIYKTNAYTFAQAEEVNTARRGLQTWVSDAREMDFGANGAYPFVLVEPHRMYFYADIDPDNITEYIEYELSSTTMYRRVYKASGYPAVYSTSSPQVFTLSEYVQNELNAIPTFRYYNSAGTEINNPSAQITDIRYITINTIVNVDPVNDPGEFMLSGSAAPRNLKDNL